MQHVYKVHPVECQPQWDATPQPVQYQWGKGFLAAAVLAFAFVAVSFVTNAAWLLGGGS